MKTKLIGLSQRYVTALRKHLKQGPRASLLPALRLGRRAVVLRVEMLDLAREAIIPIVLTLKQEARSNTRGFKNEIAKTQRLVVKSARSVRRFAHELNVLPHA